MAADLARLARKWMRQTQQGKGLRLDPQELDLLNAVGLGELLAAKAAELQRHECEARIAGMHAIEALPPPKSRIRASRPAARPRS